MGGCGYPMDTRGPCLSAGGVQGCPGLVTTWCVGIVGGPWPSTGSAQGCASLATTGRGLSTPSTSCPPPTPAPGMPLAHPEAPKGVPRGGDAPQPISALARAAWGTPPWLPCGVPGVCLQRPCGMYISRGPCWRQVGPTAAVALRGTQGCASSAPVR